MSEENKFEFAAEKLLRQFLKINILHFIGILLEHLMDGSSERIP